MAILGLLNNLKLQLKQLRILGVEIDVLLVRVRWHREVYAWIREMEVIIAFTKTHI